ncbi:MAG TPA: MarR family transcriptional regulator [Gemmatimonadaceae bacterium]|nr:MarR family transcriptional regulator [Gemmatimonadaceae bacterium]
MHKDVRAFIERSGLLWEKDRLPRIAGRIFGLTLISPDPCSLDEIAKTLGVSRASISNDARLLEGLGFVERVSISGDRRVYFQITKQSLERSIEKRVERIRELRDLMDDATRLPIRRAEVLERIEAHRLAFGSVASALGKALTQLKARRTSPPNRRNKRT